MRRTLACLVAASLLALPGALPDADARSKKRSAMDEQRELNEAAVKAMVDGDYVQAIELLEQANEIGELNITWLNLGRAYAKADRCKDALVAYDRMAVAPRVDKPSAEQLYEILTKYRQELVTECPGNIIVRCRPRSLGVVIDGGEELACPEGPIELAPGRHTFVAMQGGAPVAEQSVEVEGLATVYVELVHEERMSSAPPPGMVADAGPSEGGAGALDILGWSSFGLGAGLLVAAAVVDATVLADHFEAFDAAVADQDFVRANGLKSIIDTTQTIDLALYISGASLAAIGTGLIVAALVTAETEAPAQASFGLSPDGGASLTWTTRF